MPLPFLPKSPVPDPSPERLAALYAFTRAQAISNPDGYANNVNWWGHVLAAGLEQGTIGDVDGSGSAASSRAGSSFATNPEISPASAGTAARDTLVLTVGDELLSRVAVDGKRPKGLGGVVDTLASQRTLIKLAAYNALTTPVDQGASLAKRALGYGWSLVFGKAAPAPEDACWKTAQGRWVHIPNVKAAATSFAAHLSANPPLHHSDALYSRASFAEAFATSAPAAPLTRRDIDALILYLERDVGSVTVDGDVIKVSSPLGVGNGPITEADRGTLSVKSTLKAVEAQIESIQTQSIKTMDKVRSMLKAGQKASAQSYLKSKKGLDEVLAKRIATGEQLRSVLRSIDDAKSNAEIMDAYELSTASLSEALADPRLSPDRIANTTDALADVLADSKEISDAIELGGEQARAAAGVADVDEDELAAELEALVAEEKAAEKERTAQAAQQEIARLEAEQKAAVLRAAEAKRKAEEEAEKEKRAEAELSARIAAMHLSMKEGTEEKKEEGSKEKEEDEWARRHAEAQQREREEKERAEQERLQREAQRVPAE